MQTWRSTWVITETSEQSDDPDSHNYRNLSLFQFPLLLGPAPRRADPGNAVIDGAVNEESSSVDNGNVSLASISEMDSILLQETMKKCPFQILPSVPAVGGSTNDSSQSGDAEQATSTASADNNHSEENPEEVGTEKPSEWAENSIESRFPNKVSRESWYSKGLSL